MVYRPDSSAINTTICNSPERLSPLEKKDEWYAETGGIKKIIASYQNLIKEVIILFKANNVGIIYTCF